MKIIYIILSIFLAIGTSFSQDYSKEYLDEITNTSCDCLGDIPESIPPDQYSIQLGICIIRASSDYKRELKRDFNIEFEKMNTQGEELGRLIGVKMATLCPKTLMLVTQINSELKGAEGTQLFSSGRVVKIAGDIFVEFSIKDVSGKIYKFFWITYVESDFDLISNYESLKDEYLNIAYITQEFFDARIGEYREFNIITKLEIRE